MYNNEISKDISYLRICIYFYFTLCLGATQWYLRGTKVRPHILFPLIFCSWTLSRNRLIWSQCFLQKNCVLELGAMDMWRYIHVTKLKNNIIKFNVQCGCLYIMPRIGQNLKFMSSLNMHDRYNKTVCCVCIELNGKYD